MNGSKMKSNNFTLSLEVLVKQKGNIERQLRLVNTGIINSSIASLCKPVAFAIVC